jgi:hypothetical protein
MLLSMMCKYYLYGVLVGTLLPKTACRNEYCPGAEKRSVVAIITHLNAPYRVTM